MQETVLRHDWSVAILNWTRRAAASIDIDGIVPRCALLATRQNS